MICTIYRTNAEYKEYDGRLSLNSQLVHIAWLTFGLVGNAFKLSLPIRLSYLLAQKILNSCLKLLHHFSTEHLAAATERSTSESNLESPVESHRALAFSVDLLGHCSASAWLGSTDDSLSFSLIERSVAAAKRLVGLLVYHRSFYHRVNMNCMRIDFKFK